ncbi:hypothetical protein [Streptomyces sp. NPDC020298]
MFYFLLAVGVLAALTGWNHPTLDTRYMCRAIGSMTALFAVVFWWQW